MSFIKGWNFPIDVDKRSGTIKTISDNSVAKQSVEMILRTQLFERKIFGNYGSNLQSFMFGIVDSNYISLFKKEIDRAIQYCEPHVKNLDMNVSSSSGPVSKIEAEIEYTTDISPVRERTVRKISVDSNG